MRMRAITQDFLDKYNQKHNNQINRQFRGVNIFELGGEDLLNLCNFLIDGLVETEQEMEIRIRRIENESNMPTLIC